jgi:transposase InsO family protein
VDTYTKIAFAKLYDRKTPITAADLLNDRMIPFFESQEMKLLRVLTDRGTEYCGNPERNEYELYLAVEDIDHSRTKTKSPQTNGIAERFHKTALEVLSGSIPKEDLPFDRRAAGGSRRLGRRI